MIIAVTGPQQTDFPQTPPIAAKFGEHSAIEPVMKSLIIVTPEGSS
jgi:hypothetical protein